MCATLVSRLTLFDLVTQIVIECAYKEKGYE